MSKLMKKMKYIKEKIRAWIKVRKDSLKNIKKTLKVESVEIDLLLNKGEANSDVLNNRMSISKSLQELDKLESMEVAQKAKIKWAIEGDENSKYYHVILNKKRSQLAIRGILVDGIWIDSPCLVKSGFLSHFTNRFGQPQVSRLELDMDFPNKLDLDQQVELENNVTREEVNRVVWDCGADKSPGPNGFTFGFYRRYWSFLEKDVEEANEMMLFSWVIGVTQTSLILVSLSKVYDSFKDVAPALHAVRAGRVQKNNHKNKKLQMAAKGKNQGKGNTKLAYAPAYVLKPKIPSTKEG
ncbi:hypothetical protein Tco_1111445 [Tanacetum coccineum]|uniref:RNA-directed DNA polymerase, eukaryota n=1 Tax=Tanacetum coccineum TaxID=301880 RepID=A0ABQ5ILQ0_9ASTR